MSLLAGIGATLMVISVLANSVVLTNIAIGVFFIYLFIELNHEIKP